MPGLPPHGLVPRYDFQQDCLLRTTGRVLNAACKEDPAGLKLLAPDRVTNLDLRDFDHDAWYNRQEKIPIPVDLTHDLTVAPWPFPDDHFGLVVLAEILEDLPDDGCQIIVLEEARRVGKHLCITTPEDTPERDWHHLTTVTREKLKVWLEVTGWQPITFETVDYKFVPRGYFVFAKRATPLS